MEWNIRTKLQWSLNNEKDIYCNKMTQVFQYNWRE